MHTLEQTETVDPAFDVAPGPVTDVTVDAPPAPKKRGRKPNPNKPSATEANAIAMAKMRSRKALLDQENARLQNEFPSTRFLPQAITVRGKFQTILAFNGIVKIYPDVNPSELQRNSVLANEIFNNFDLFYQQSMEARKNAVTPEELQALCNMLGCVQGAIRTVRKTVHEQQFVHPITFSDEWGSPFATMTVCFLPIYDSMGEAFFKILQGIADAIKHCQGSASNHSAQDKFSGVLTLILQMFTLDELPNFAYIKNIMLESDSTAFEALPATTTPETHSDAPDATDGHQNDVPEEIAEAEKEKEEEAEEEI